MGQNLRAHRQRDTLGVGLEHEGDGALPRDEGEHGRIRVHDQNPGHLAHLLLVGTWPGVFGRDSDGT